MQLGIKTDVLACCSPLSYYVSEWECVYSTEVSQMIPHSGNRQSGLLLLGNEAANVAPFLVGTLVWISVNIHIYIGLPESWSRLWVGIYVHRSRRDCLLQ